MRDLLNLRRKRAAQALCGAFLLAAFAPGAASAGERAGALECYLSGNNITVIVENQMLDCVFQGVDERMPPAHYVGTLTKVGANLTVNGHGNIIWLVAAATGHVGRARSRAITSVPKPRSRLAWAEAAPCWSAAPTIRFPCSLCRSRAVRVLASPPGSRG